jgi:anti-sigma factor RsiW
MTQPTTGRDWILHAYADGELEPSEKMLVERELSHDHEARVAIEAWRRQKQALKQAFERVLTEELPPGIKSALKRGKPGPSGWQLPAAAAALLAILAGAYMIYLNLDSSSAEARALADQALSAHIVYSAETRHPVEVAASDRQHLVSWLSKRMDRAIALPDLSHQGFHLVGGRLLHEDGKPAAQFMYEDAGKRRITVYLAHHAATGEIAFSFEKDGGYTTCYWLDDNMGYAVAGAFAPEELLPLARLIYERLERDE